MKAMILNQITDITEHREPLTLISMPIPNLDEGELLIQVRACGVCHTELDEIEGRTPPAFLPMILGHQVVGFIKDKGKNAQKHHIGERVGVAWIYHACGVCPYCRQEKENLCAQFRATGRDAHGGYAEYMKVSQDFVFSIPVSFSDAEAAPLLCAGAIGYRSLKLTNLQDGQNLGLSGFGASGHLVLIMAKHIYPNSQVYIFSRNEAERCFALELGADWAGDFSTEPPVKMDGIIDTTPVWKPIVAMLKFLAPGGRLVINAIRKEENDKDFLTKINYADHMWLEKEIKSVANITRKDVQEFLDLAAKIPIKAEFQEYNLEDANQALFELKSGKIRGAKVLLVGS